jgi:O-antigen chain-terminating methyltransferase
MIKRFLRLFSWYRRYKLIEKLEAKLIQQEEELRITKNRLTKNAEELLSLSTLVYEQWKQGEKALEQAKNSYTELNVIFDQRLFTVEENVRSNNWQLETLTQKQSEIPELKAYVRRKLATVEKQLSMKNETLSESDTKQTEKLSYVDNADVYSGIDYFDFENHFRGSEQLIMERQEEYLCYFISRNHVIDLGCGRGEFLELLRANNVQAIGVDLYSEFVMLCQKKGLTVYQKNAIQYLEEVDRTDGIFAGQLVEHLSIEQVIYLCDLAYQKLDSGCYLVMETPNPMSLAIYTHAFYMDPSHSKPVHPLTLQYIARRAGFSSVEIRFTEKSKLDESIPELQSESIDNIVEFNQSMQTLSNYMYGSQDYAIIAKK